MSNAYEGVMDTICFCRGGGHAPYSLTTIQRHRQESLKTQSALSSRETSQDEECGYCGLVQKGRIVAASLAGRSPCGVKRVNICFHRLLHADLELGESKPPEKLAAD